MLIAGGTGGLRGANAQTLQGPQAIHAAWTSPEYRRVELPAAAAPSTLPRREGSEALPASPLQAARSVLAGPGTVALLLLDRGQVVFEGYAQGATENDRLLSFSMAKTLTSLAVGEALCAGHIRSLDDRAEAYARELAGTAYGEASVRDLLRMASGAKGGSPVFHGQPRNGALSDLLRGRSTVLKMLREYGTRDATLLGPVPPGSRFVYSNLDTDALSRVVAGATGEPFAAWFGKAVLAPAGPEQTSFWGTDAEGHAIAHAMYMATLRDWARLAQRTLEIVKGRAGSACMQEYLRAASTRQMATFQNDGFRGYGYQIWLDERMQPRSSFWMLGFGGQRIGIDPASERIVVTFAWQPQADVFELFRRWAREAAD